MRGTTPGGMISGFRDGEVSVGLSGKLKRPEGEGRFKTDNVEVESIDSLLNEL